VDFMIQEFVSSNRRTQRMCERLMKANQELIGLLRDGRSLSCADSDTSGTALRTPRIPSRVSVRVAPNSRAGGRGSPAGAQPEAVSSGRGSPAGESPNGAYDDAPPHCAWTQTRPVASYHVKEMVLRTFCDQKATTARYRATVVRLCGCARRRLQM
jgi:hypothetical protein